jgi:hypothetical protein
VGRLGTYRYRTGHGVGDLYDAASQTGRMRFVRVGSDFGKEDPT